MSVNPDGMASGVADEFVDLEHQVIRQKIELPVDGSIGLSPGEPGAEFEPGERQLDREEVAQLVAYRRYGYISYTDFVVPTGDVSSRPLGAIVDASVGINGDLFREVTTQTNPEPNLFVDSGGEIGLLDTYTLQATPSFFDGSDGAGGGGQSMFCENTIDFYDWPTGGPIVDSFDTITCGFGSNNFNQDVSCNIELRYDFWWDVAEQGRSTNPFGRPSTR
jgi:hypothetical protein